VNQRIATADDTVPSASTENEVLLRDIALRSLSFGRAISETSTMSPDDRADALGRLLDEHDAERARIVSAREGAYRLAELECLLDPDPDTAENRWNAENNGGMRQ
jgi:hypothetical protein